MKLQTLTLAALTLGFVATSAVSSAPADARSLKPMIVAAEFTRLNVDPQLQYNPIVSGKVTVDYKAREVTLTLDEDTCPVGAMCLLFRTVPQTITLPMTSAKTDRCGTVVIQAKEDLRPADGALQTLTVRDNSQNKCPTFARVADTTVSYGTLVESRMNHRIETRSTFEAGRLEAAPARR